VSNKQIYTYTKFEPIHESGENNFSKPTVQSYYHKKSVVSTLCENEQRPFFLISSQSRVIAIVVDLYKLYISSRFFFELYR
jgi:hypothetical protein